VLIFLLPVAGPGFGSDEQKKAADLSPSYSLAIGLPLIHLPKIFTLVF
jgi:hypothetical protein